MNRMVQQSHARGRLTGKNIDTEPKTFLRPPAVEKIYQANGKKIAGKIVRIISGDMIAVLNSNKQLENIYSSAALSLSLLDRICEFL